MPCSPASWLAEGAGTGWRARAWRCSGSGLRLRRPVTQPAGDDGVSPDGGVSPDEPDADEFELIGGIDDLGAADLGPIAPNARDPDADSGRPRK